MPGLFSAGFISAVDKFMKAMLEHDTSVYPLCTIPAVYVLVWLVPSQPGYVFVPVGVAIRVSH